MSCVTGALNCLLDINCLLSPSFLIFFVMFSICMHNVQYLHAFYSRKF